MRVYQIRPNPNRYQYFMPFLFWYPNPIPRDRVAHAMWIEEPRLREPDFFNPTADYLITSPGATQTLREHLENAGDLLPFSYNGQVYTVTDVTRYLDVLDQEQTEFLVVPTSGIRLDIERYAFDANRFSPRTSLFKLHEDLGMNIYVVEGTGGFTREFREIIESEGLIGLEFREVWNNDQDPEFHGTPWSIADFGMDPEDKKMHDEWEKKDAEKRSP